MCLDSTVAPLLVGSAPWKQHDPRPANFHARPPYPERYSCRNDDDPCLMRCMASGCCEAGVRGAACWGASQHIKGCPQLVQRLRSSVVMQLVVVAVSCWLGNRLDPAAAGILALWAMVAFCVPFSTSCSTEQNTGSQHGSGQFCGSLKGRQTPSSVSALHSSIQQCRCWCSHQLRQAVAWCRSLLLKGTATQPTATANALPAELHYTGCTRSAPVSIKVRQGGLAAVSSMCQLLVPGMGDTH